MKIPRFHGMLGSFSRIARRLRIHPSGDEAGPCSVAAEETSLSGSIVQADSEGRRQALGNLALIGASVLGFFALPGLWFRQLFAAAERHGASAVPLPKAKWGMVIDLDKCTGCQACVVACKTENNVPVAGPAQTDLDRGIFWMDMLVEKEDEEYPDLHRQFLPTPCNHCENAPCTKVCPVKATFINEEGIVAQLWARCIGCRYCTTACPYTRRYFNWKAPSWPEELKSQLNPDVSTRPVGVVEKCTFCHQRIRKIKEQVRDEGRQLTDADVQKLPACAEVCPAEAIAFGNMNDRNSKVTRLGKSPRAFRLQEELGTRPKVVYLREAKWKE